MLIPPPTNTRETLELFRLFEAASALDGLLNKLDLSSVTSRQVYWSVLARLPELRLAGPSAETYSARTHIRAALAGEEFQQKLIPLILNAYPEKRRLLFVHIPKCAGSDLTVNLLKRYPGLNQRIAERSWMPPPKLFTALNQLVLTLPFSDTVFLHGHVPLRVLLNAQLIRFSDAAFAVLRDPRDRVISQINYIITRFTQDKALAAVDTRDWLRFINRATLDRAMASGNMGDLAAEILHRPELAQSNVICRFLGNGDIKTATEMCGLSNIELTTTEHYQDWLKSRWGIETTTRTNASKPMISFKQFGKAEQKKLDEINEDDRQLFDLVSAQIKSGGALSTRGQTLLEAAAA